MECCIICHEELEMTQLKMDPRQSWLEETAKCCSINYYHRIDYISRYDKRISTESFFGTVNGVKYDLGQVWPNDLREALDEIEQEMAGPDTLVSSVTITTQHGETECTRVWCEWTGKAIGWQTIIPEEKFKPGMTPAYLSLEVIDYEGNILMDLSSRF